MSIHMIGNAHLDPVWLWQWQEGFQETKATFRSALDRITQFDDFIFTSSSAAFYEWIEDHEPQMFAEIRERIREGRWILCGGWWIQPDCNIPSGESFVRQGLYGQHYFREKFGVTAVVGYNPDSFGHHAMLPQILKKSGMNYYTFMRPQPHEKELPSRLFWWESPDGTRVLTFRIPFEYTKWGHELDEHVYKCAAELEHSFDHLMCFYGVGNHGGGPTVENIRSIKRLSTQGDLPELILSSPNRYFEEADLTQPIPVVRDELQMHAVGCYSVHSGIKFWNREAENALAAAEKYTAIAMSLGRITYPKDFAKAWKNVLFNQFHDILAGTSLEQAYEDARDMHGESMSIAARNLNHAVQTLSWNIHIDEEPDTIPIVVFNPHAWSCRMEVALQFGHPGLVGKSALRGNEILVDDHGKRVPMQPVQSWATTKFRNRICFTADLPSMGYRVYRIKADEQAEALPSMEASRTLLENDRFLLRFDEISGFISSLFDKQAGIEVFSGPAARPVVIHDPSDTWGHGYTKYDEVIGTFMAKRVKLVEHGPVKSVVRVTSEYGKSTVMQDFTLYKELERIDVKVKVNWQEQFKMLKLRFPVNVLEAKAKATFEVPYGHIGREADGTEVPGQSWIDVTGPSVEAGLYGVSLLNDGKYSFDVTGTEMSITVLRSPIYAHHAPHHLDPDMDYSFIDQGIQEFTYSIVPHQGTWKEAGTVRSAAELNQRAITVTETYHRGELPQADSYVSVNHASIIVSALKKAENEEALILRCYEAHHEAAEAQIAIPHLNRVIDAVFTPSEIKTWRIPLDSSLSVTETNMLEDY
jgi:alpha-mannosidase